MSLPSDQPLCRDRTLDPHRTAVLVVDAQRLEVEGEIRERVPFFVREVETRAVPAIRRLIDAARPRGVEIVYTVIESLSSPTSCASSATWPNGARGWTARPSPWAT